jgi:hypothetical protein
MECINDILCGNRTIIGIRDFNNCALPESNLFINDLPGISLKSASKISDEEKQSGYNLLQHSINMALRHVYDEFREQAYTSFDSQSIVESRQVDVFGPEIIPAAALERGLIIKRWRSELAQIFVHEVYIKANQNGNVDVKIYDGCNTIQKTATVVAGCITKVRFDYKATEEEIKILFDQTAFDTYGCSLVNSSWDCRCGQWQGKGLFVNGWNGTAEQGKCFGVGVYASVKCYFENIFCALLDQFYFILWYRAGIVFLSELIYSDRINAITLFTKDRAKELIEEYTAIYNAKYQTLINNARLFISQTKGECISCNGTKITQQTP